MEMIYLDNNATTKPAPEVVAIMAEVLKQHWANPSSTHRAGQAVARKVALAREAVARLIGCSERELVFTSGGTEAANLAIAGSLEAQPRKHLLVTSRVEHSSVREMVEVCRQRGAQLIYLPNDCNGIVEVHALAELLKQRANEIAVVSVMWVNNETGVIQPIEQIGRLCREHGVRFHTDGTQCVGKLAIDVSSLPIDLLSFAAHKFHGPKGIGALYLRKPLRVLPQVVGGHQELDRRGGTENVPGIVGMGEASRLAREWVDADGPSRQQALRDRFERTLVDQVDDAVVNGAAAPRVWNTSNIGFARLEAEAILLLLSERGVCASAGSACSSGSLDPSPIILAMGTSPEIAHGSVRFSLSRYTTAAEIERALEIIPGVTRKLRESMSVV